MKLLWGIKQIDRSLVMIARLFVGGLFTFSGIVKAVDPLGTAYKIDDYLIEMGLSELMLLSLPLSLVMVVGEFTLGMLLLLGLYRKGTLRLILLFLLFFTPLTLWIALANPVEDCGCFGDAIKISNWETFWKNLVLSAALLLLLFNQKKIGPLFGRRMAPLAAGFIVLYGLLFTLHNLNRLPLFDFRPFHIGASIPEQMEVEPELADLYETIFIYQKDGVEKEFTEENYPWNDSTWHYVDMRNRLVREGSKPAIEDFVLTLIQRDEMNGSMNAGGDMTRELLQEKEWLFLMITYSLGEMEQRHLDQFKALHQFAEERGYPFYLVTSSPSEVIASWEEQQRTGFRFANGDEKVLKTMVRSNPGLMLLREGVVINKWDDSLLPDPLPKGLSMEESEMVQQGTMQTRNIMRLLLISLLLLLPLLFLKGVERKSVAAGKRSQDSV
ncbi:hypothetical protein JS578_01980 [Dysgonomonadaceae bacterium zrk40]|nr:hypothetical protein JS578_01980 [Dysgonomonadaceae bacterium zrk40]